MLNKSEISWKIQKCVKLLLYIFASTGTIFLPIYLLYLEMPVVAIFAFIIGMFCTIQTLEHQ